MAVLGASANNDPSVFVGGRFEESEDGELTLVAPAGVGVDVRLYGQIAGSSVENEGSGHVRFKSALAVLHCNGWFEVEQTVGELRIRLGERAKRSTELRPR